jgi:hypothetical protein
MSYTDRREYHTQFPASYYFPPIETSIKYWLTVADNIKRDTSEKRNLHNAVRQGRTMKINWILGRI